MQEWNDSVKRLILGCDAQDAPWTAPSAELGAALDKMAEEPAERRLLKAAVMFNFTRLVGQSHQRALAVAPAQSDSVEQCSERAEELLRAALRAKDTRLLAEYLTTLADAGRVSPPAALADLFDAALNQPRLQVSLRHVMGARGRWLCGLNPKWETLRSDAPASEELAHLSGVARVDAFRRLREADPAAALNQLNAIWKDEPAKERAALLEVMKVGLNPNDAEFLAACVDDRSLPVRYQATRFLAQLGDASVLTPLREWLASALQLQKALLKKSQLNIEPPKDFDKSWEKWGVKEDLSHLPNRTKVGKRAGWFYQVLALLPPRVSAEILQASLEQTIDLYRRSDYAEAALLALSEGAMLHGDVTYFETLFPALTEVERTEYLGGLAAGFAAEKIEPLILPALQAAMKKDSQFWLPVLYQLKAFSRLTPKLSEAIAEMIRAKILEGESWYYDAHQTIDQLAYQFSLTSYEKIRSLLEPLQDDRTNPLLAVYKNRVDFHKELQS
ncbi:DUF5691 domain-containing protein [Hahella sp. HN01]|uniref:DUF5691 domain-containing protein n=1 Tax=Hahella sp. HN01 TaxID=2847262 RepID=UPI001C1E8E70|nr:DUF5691 domain-containing protein [Hahella sp. HN01]MBU6952097.1 hypothetical protein [Hahella sp. HN01]